MVVVVGVMGGVALVAVFDGGGGEGREGGGARVGCAAGVGRLVQMDDGVVWGEGERVRDV